MKQRNYAFLWKWKWNWESHLPVPNKDQREEELGFSCKNALHLTSQITVRSFKKGIPLEEEAEFSVTNQWKEGRRRDECEKEFPSKPLFLGVLTVDSSKMLGRDQPLAGVKVHEDLPEERKFPQDCSFTHVGKSLPVVTWHKSNKCIAPSIWVAIQS